MFSKIFRIFLFSCAFILKAQFFLHAQETVFPGALKEKRAALKKTLIENNIIKNLSLPLNAGNEEAWQDAFNTINLTKYEPVFVQNKITEAVKYLPKSGREYKKELLQLINSDFPLTYHTQVFSLFKTAGNDYLLLAMAANYILNKPIAAEIKFMQATVNNRLKKDPENAVLSELKEQLNTQNLPTGRQAQKLKTVTPDLSTLFSKNFLPGEIVLYSIQRKNRNYPGIVIIRKADGSFLRNSDSSIFTISQLARSQGNMPGYISLGNTPQGIFRMDGFDTSKSYFIGPTTNIQLTMPFEYKASHFYREAGINDTVWTLERYKKLLPQNLQNYHPLYGTYYAGKAGRNEIIAHGTTIDPSYYTGKTYYPYTPSAGCLSTAEFWDETKGTVDKSDQLLLVNAVKKAGGANGYLVVIELNDKSAPVSLKELISWLVD